MRVERAAVAARSVVVTDDVRQEEWDAFVDAFLSSTGYHRWCWRGVFERAFRHETVYLAARGSLPAAARGSSPGAGDTARPTEPGPILGVLPLVRFRSRLFGRFLVSLPFVNYGGVLAEGEAVREALLARAREEAVRRGASHVEMRHTARLFPQLPVKQHKVAMTLPLPPNEEAAWKAFDNKVRNQVRKAEKSGLTALVGGHELLDDFYRVFARNMRDLGTPVYSRRLFAEVLENVPDTRAYVVRLDAAPIAAGVTVAYRRSIENPWASSLREHRSLCPNMLLYWTMMRDAIARGYTLFDFGRSTPGEGTYQFKKQWGAVESPFFWEYALNGAGALPDQSPKNEKFQAAIAVWQRLPLWATRLLGPTIVRNIP